MSKTVTNTMTASLERARALDAADPLAQEREQFCIPLDSKGKQIAYFAGNSLGLQPKSARQLVLEELDDWSALGVEGHFDSRRPWFAYHELLREPIATIVGANPTEVVAMNTLTTNLHLMMASFYRPTQDRYRILIEDTAFPSDSYAVASQARFHGFDPADAIVRLKPRAGEHLLRTEDIISLLDKQGDSIALVMLAGVNYLTGQLMDMDAITREAHAHNCAVGWDLAHAVGNVPLQLHDWNADFAVWCTYKYLNAGPGAVAGCFVHERHWAPNSPYLPRFEGWWGHDPEARFRMEPNFVPAPGADAWQLSNPPIFSMAPLLASAQLFNRIGMDTLRRKSIALTGFLESLLNELPTNLQVITPTNETERGCQLSIAVNSDPKELQSQLRQVGILCDAREPNIIRTAPVPLYNSFHDCWRLANALSQLV